MRHKSQWRINYSDDLFAVIIVASICMYSMVYGYNMHMHAYYHIIRHNKTHVKKRIMKWKNGEGRVYTSVSPCQCIRSMANRIPDNVLQ